jgi:hypothetical protein
MQYARVQESHPSRVVVVYETDALCYLLPAGATLGDVAECMNHLDHQSDRAPVAIYLKFDSPPDKPPSTRPWSWSRSPSWQPQADRAPTLKWAPIIDGIG